MRLPRFTLTRLVLRLGYFSLRSLPRLTWLVFAAGVEALWQRLRPALRVSWPIAENRPLEVFARGKTKYRTIPGLHLDHADRLGGVHAKDAPCGVVSVDAAYPSCPLEAVHVLESPEGHGVGAGSMAQLAPLQHVPVAVEASHCVDRANRLGLWLGWDWLGRGLCRLRSPTEVPEAAGDDEDNEGRAEDPGREDESVTHPASVPRRESPPKAPFGHASSVTERPHREFLTSKAERRAEWRRLMAAEPDEPGGVFVVPASRRGGAP